jgi:predicted nuclease of predicted toxin-antitoxin system
VKFLVDANLPPDLCVWLRGRGHEAEHLADLNLLTATDTQLWDRCKVQRLVVVTKDVDFYDRALVLGAPPQVLHFAVGNCSNTRLFEILASEWTDIEAALFAGSRLISINQERIEVFP